jgi:hypothetical protein
MQATGDPLAVAGFRLAVVGLPMEDAPLGRKPILAPQTLDMNERALPLAEQQMLQSGEGQEIGFEVH